MKTKNTGPKSQKLSGLKAAKPSSSGKLIKKPIRKSVSVVSPSKQPKEKASSEKVSLTDRISKSNLVKSAAVVKLKTQRTKLKLVAKAGSKIPVSKITRSEGPSVGNNVINARFGSEQAAPVAVKPVLAVRAAVEKVVEVSIAKPVEAVYFKLGDKIVYPGHGVGEIEGVRTTVVGGQEHHIYNIKILDSGMKVMVPVTQAASVGLRKIVDSSPRSLSVEC